MQDAVAGIDLSVVVPVRNEAGNIGALVHEIAGVLRGRSERPFEILVVNDASTDASLAELQQAAARVPELRVLSHAAAAGQSAALRSGILAARGACIATLDGDGQNPPQDIPEMLTRLLAEPGLGLVNGQRLRRHDSPWRWLCSRIANAVRGGLLGDQTPDSGCGIKVFRREAWLALPYFDHMHRFLPALFRSRGWAVAHQAVAHRPRRHGVSKYRTWQRLTAGIVDLAGVLWLRQRQSLPGPVQEWTP